MVDRTVKPVDKSDIDQFGFSVRNVYSAQNQFPAITQNWKNGPIERGNLWKKSLELLRSVKALVRRLGLCSIDEEEQSSKHSARKFLITNSKQLEQNKNAKFYKKNYGVRQNDFSWSSSTKSYRDGGNYENSRVVPLIRWRDERSSRTRTLFLELSGRVQELQNEVVWTILRTSRTLNRYAVEIPTLPINRCYSLNILFLKGCWGLHFVSPRRKERAAKHFGIHMVYRENVFANPHASSSAPYPQELNPWRDNYWGAASYVYSGEEWKTRTKSWSEMPVLDRESKIQSSSVEETLQRIMGQTNNDCRFRSPFLTSSPTPATFACWKIRFKTEVCTCSPFPTEAMQWIKEVELADSVDELKIFVIYSWYFQCRILKYLMRGLFQHWTKPSIIPTSKGESVWRKPMAQKKDRFFFSR